MVTRGRRIGLAVVGVLALAVLGALGGSWLVGEVVTAFSDDRSSRTEGSPPAEASAVLPPEVVADAEAAIVDRVVDGDTVRVLAAPGGSTSEGGSIRVRLLNIDAPELPRDGRPAECGAQEAAERLEELIAAGDLVWLVGDREDRDVHDRLLRGMWTDDGVFLNEMLAEEGLAEDLLITPNDRFHERIVAAAGRAKGEHRGIWGELCPR